MPFRTLLPSVWIGVLSSRLVFLRETVVFVCCLPMLEHVPVFYPGRARLPFPRGTSRLRPHAAGCLRSCTSAARKAGCRRARSPGRSEPLVEEGRIHLSNFVPFFGGECEGQ